MSLMIAESVKGERRRVERRVRAVDHIASHRIASHHIASHHIASLHITSHLITSHHIASHHITSHRITLYHITSHHITAQQRTTHRTWYLHLHERSPKPRSESQVQDMPIPRVNSAAPSGKSLTFWKFPWNIRIIDINATYIHTHPYIHTSTHPHTQMCHTYMSTHTHTNKNRLPNYIII